MATNIISIRNQELLHKTNFSSLKSDVASGASTVSVYSISKFSVNDILLFGEFGQEHSEIIPVHSVTAPSGNTITLSTTLSQSHTKDTKVSIMLFNQIEILYATTIDGSKTSITTVSIDPQMEETTYIPSNTTGYYFVRWYNSVTSTSGDYSDPIPAGGFDSNTLSYIIDVALTQTGKQISEKLTLQNLISEANACLRYIRGKLKRWSNVQEFDYVVDQMDRGEYKFSLPSTYYDQNSNRSCLDVRVGDVSLDYIDKQELNERMRDVHLTTLSSAASAGDTTLSLTSAADFDDSGTVNLYSGTTKYAVTYTAKSGNTLTGVPASGTGAVTATIASGTNVWQGESEGTPEVYTIYDGYLYIWPLINSTDSGMNIKMDFHTDIVEVNSDSDEITLARHDMVKYWLKWAIRNITERNGKPDFQDGDWVMFNQILSDAIRRESSGQKFKMRPVINGIYYRGEMTNRNATFENS